MTISYTVEFLKKNAHHFTLDIICKNGSKIIHGEKWLSISCNEDNLNCCQRSIKWIHAKLGWWQNKTKSEKPQKMHSQSKVTCGLNIPQKVGPTKLITDNQ